MHGKALALEEQGLFCWGKTGAGAKKCSVMVILYNISENIEKNHIESLLQTALFCDKLYLAETQSYAGGEQ